MLGVAPVNSGTHREAIHREGFRISLEETRFSQFPSAEIWAGVILHEMLHNMGYDHSTANNRFDGSYMYESGWCFERSFSPKSFNLAGEPVGGTVIGD